jgi:hypothetical protein
MTLYVNEVNDMIEEVKIVKYGRGMNSRKPERRNLYIEIQPNNIHDIAQAILQFRLSWKFDPPNLDTWYRYQTCKYCVARAKYEHEKFTRGEWVWNRRFCWRHYLIEHFGEITAYDDMIESNRLIDLTMSKSQITLKTASNNYKYNIEINRQYATVAVDYKGSRYVFKYNNHLNALPYSSTYLVLVWEVTRITNYVAEFLKSIINWMEKNKCAHFNVFINDKLVVPACT